MWSLIICHFLCNLQTNHILDNKTNSKYKITADPQGLLHQSIFPNPRCFRGYKKHSVTLQDTSVLAGRDDYIHNHPLIKSLGVKFIISSFAAVKSRFSAFEAWQNVIVRSYTRDSVLNHPSGSKKILRDHPSGLRPSGWSLRIFLSPSGMIKSRIPRLPQDNATLSLPL